MARPSVEPWVGLSMTQTLPTHVPSGGSVSPHVLAVVLYASCRYLLRAILAGVDGAKGDIMAIFGIYSKDWTYNYGAYQCTVNYFDDIMFDKDAFLTEAEVEELTPADSWVTPDTSDDEYTE